MMWLVLIGASFGELAFMVFMKKSNGFKNIKYTLLTIVALFFSIGGLSLAIKTLPLGISYAVWTGLGTVFTVAYGIIFFKESKDIKKIIFIALILIGIVGLRLSTIQ